MSKYFRKDWAPAPFDHLLPELRAFIQSVFQPAIRECYKNCQMLMLEAEHVPALKDRLVYHEGWIVCPVPVPHAWLTLDDTIQDPTLSDRCLSDYGESTTYTAREIRAHCVRTGYWTALDYEKIQELMFGKERVEMLKKLSDKSTACPKCKVGGGYHVVGCEKPRTLAELFKRP